MRAARTPGGWRSLALAGAASLLTACGSLPHLPASPIAFPSWPGAKHPKIDPDLPQMPAAGSGRGGYYQDDGPGDNPPPNLRAVPDAIVKAEPYSRYANRPYAVLGKSYVPLLGDDPYVQRGVASWYGKKFHGQRTSSGEIYDMYQMTAAHPTLPIPSFARVTSLDSGQQVVVRINDRGPFHASRIIDVSYTAALKLGLLGKGSHQVEVERLLPDDPAKLATRIRNAPLLPDPVAKALADPQLNPTTNDVTGVAGVTTSPVPAFAPPAPVVAGFYVQLGAFSQSDKAAGMRDRLAQSGALNAALEVVQAGALHRLFCGPFLTRAEAQQALRLVPAAFGLKPLVVRRD